MYPLQWQPTPSLSLTLTAALIVTAFSSSPLEHFSSTIFDWTKVTVLVLVTFWMGFVPVLFRYCLVEMGLLAETLHYGTLFSEKTNLQVLLKFLKSYISFSDLYKNMSGPQEKISWTVGSKDSNLRQSLLNCNWLITKSMYPRTLCSWV